jgi:hypothetical protein
LCGAYHYRFGSLETHEWYEIETLRGKKKTNTLVYLHSWGIKDGHYLNLPILEDGRVVGIVDVLKLTYATLEQVREWIVNKSVIFKLTYF